MGNLPPQMLDQIRQAQERAQVTDQEVQAGPSKRARLAFLQAAKASDRSSSQSQHQQQQPALAVDASLAGVACSFCQAGMVPSSSTDTRGATLALPCRHAYHMDCLCANWYAVASKEDSENGNDDSKLPAHDNNNDDDDVDTIRKCGYCHQPTEQQQQFVAANVPTDDDDDDSKKPAAAAAAAPDASSPSTQLAPNIMESDDPSMLDILLDVRGKLWDSNHKVVSAALRMLVQIIHSDIDSDHGSDDDDDDDNDSEDEKEDYSDLALMIGLPVVLVYCLSRHAADHADIPKMILGVFEWLVSREEAACHILARIDDSLLRIVQAIQQNPSDGSLQYTGLQVLTKLVADDTRLKLNSAGIVVATFEAMQKNKENTLVQESALQFLDKYTTDSDFAVSAVAGHDQTLRERHAQCIAGSLLCISRNATNDPDAIIACGHLIFRLAGLDVYFRAAMHKVAGAPIKQVFVNFGANADIKQLYRDVLRCLVTKPPALAATGTGTDTEAASNSSQKMPAQSLTAKPAGDAETTEASLAEAKLEGTDKAT